MSGQNCPITGKSNTDFICKFDNSIASDKNLVNSPVENRLSKESGLIFNSSGARGKEMAFYMDQYDLRSEHVATELMYFDQGKAKGFYDNMLEFITSSVKLPAKGKVLEVGCGKGLLLRRFANKFPDWDIFAVEPSKNANAFFKEVMPKVNCFEGTFENSPYHGKQFDLVMATGVLEHIPNPVDFLRLFRNCIADNGYGYIGVPNFETNPSDLFTFDHLSRFTPDTITALFSLAGFTVVNKWALSTRVPMWYVIKKADPNSLQSVSAELIAKSQALATSSLQFIQNTFASYNKCVEESKPGDKIGVFGLGTIGFFGTRQSKLTKDKISFFYDDNSTFWGKEQMGITVHDPSLIVADGVNRIVVSANPCYLDSISERINKIIAGHNIKLYLP